MRRLTVLAIFLAGTIPAWGQACYHGKAPLTKHVPSFLITISHHHTEDPDDVECLARIVNDRKRAIFSALDWGFSIPVAGQDVNSDRAPDVVFEGYSGGAHCCWTYYVVSLGEKPGLIKKFENDRGAKFVLNRATGKMEIQTLDGAFDYFDEFCHACSPFPEVFLRLEGTKLMDISREHLADYDKTIRKLRRSLPPADLARFRVIDEPWSKAGEEEAASTVAEIAVAYLYSGRQTQAHKTIQEMWPPFDQERIWRAILEARRFGILRYVGNGIPQHAITHPGNPH